eukprot:1171583-Ditylum_brightwellii.AAC.1
MAEVYCNNFDVDEDGVSPEERSPNICSVQNLTEHHPWDVQSTFWMHTFRIDLVQFLSGILGQGWESMLVLPVFTLAMCI